MLSLDDGPESDPVRLAIMTLRRTYEIDDDMTQPIKDYEKFKEVKLIRYAGRIAKQDHNGEYHKAGELPISPPPRLERATRGKKKKESNESVMRAVKAKNPVFTSAQRFLSAFGIINSHFRVGRHLYRASDYQTVMKSRFAEWKEAICVEPIIN